MSDSENNYAVGDNDIQYLLSENTCDSQTTVTSDNCSECVPLHQKKPSATNVMFFDDLVPHTSDYSSYLPPCNPFSDINEINISEMQSILSHSKNDANAQLTIVDCRYSYEYEGGHVINAKNYETFDTLCSELIPQLNSTKINIILFYCEYSQVRAPEMWKRFRLHDRKFLNVDSYPSLSYPYIYVIKGGYKAIYESLPSLCVPHQYISMNDPLYHEQFKQKCSSYVDTYIFRRPKKTNTLHKVPCSYKAARRLFT
ncbi:hypothetical protein WA158_004613 [Blastocystis sp. Blastoise]